MPRTATATVQPEQELLRGRLRSVLQARGDLTLKYISRLSGVSYCAVSSFVNASRPTGRLVTEAVDRAVTLIESGHPRAHARREVVATEFRKVKRVQPTRAFYQTQTVTQVAKALTYCHENSTIGVVVGDFGFGKSMAVADWQQSPAGKAVDVLVYEFNVTTAGRTSECLHQVAELLGVNATSEVAVFEAIVERLRSQPCLLIFDQVEIVAVRVLQAIRQLHDRTEECGCGVVLLAAPALMTRIAASRTQDLGALTSRVGLWVELQGLSREEMAAIVKSEGIDQVTDGAFAVWFRAVGGSMRRLMKSIDLLKTSHAGRVVTERTIAGVCERLLGIHLRVEDGG